MRFESAKLWLCLPFVLVFLGDASVTLAGQSAAWWAGDYRQVNEVFPLFAWALNHGLGGVLLVSLGWLAVFCLLIIVLPPMLAEITALALVNGHTWGMMTWLVYDLHLDYHVCLLFFVIAAAVFMGCYRRWQARKIA